MKKILLILVVSSIGAVVKGQTTIDPGQDLSCHMYCTTGIIICCTTPGGSTWYGNLQAD